MPTDHRDRAVRPMGVPYTVAVFIVLVVVGVAAGVVAGLELPTFEEDGPVERAQIVLWAIASIAGVALSLSATRRSTRAILLLLATLAALAVARELDAHIYLNPEKLGDMGVRYRIDWWLDGGVSPMLKAMWAMIAISAAAALFGPAWFAKGAIIRIFRERALPFWFFATAGVCLITGFAVDDLLRNKIDLQLGHVIEESVELVGPILYLAGTLAIAAARPTEPTNE